MRISQSVPGGKTHGLPRRSIDCQSGGVDVVGHPIIDGCDLLDLSQWLDLELIGFHLDLFGERTTEWRSWSRGGRLSRLARSCDHDQLLEKDEILHALFTATLTTRQPLVRC